MPAIAPVAPKAGPKLAPATPRSAPAARASSAVTPISKAPVAGPVRAPTLPAFARTAGPTRPLAALPSRTERMGAGQPLAPHVQEAIERSFQVDMSPVRVHTGALAETHAKQLSARAFAHGNDIFLGRGEHPGDVQLLAHEAAHVVQQQSGTAHQRWSDDRGDRYEREADRAAAAVQRGESFAVQERVSGPRVQRSILGDALDWIADKANIIPGFRMFTIVLGVNPVNMSAVKADGPTFLKAILEMVPGGGLIVQALDSSGIFEKVAAWMSAKIKTLGMVGSSIYDALKKFLDSLGLRDIVNLGGAWDRAKKIFTDPIERLINFATGLAKDIIDFVRTAILAPLAKLAEGTKGYPLLKAVLGHDPVTGEPVPDDTSALISGILTLAGQEEVWENIKKANALARISAWFKTAKSELVGMVMQIPAMVIGTIKSFEIMDLIVLPRAIVKVVKVFGGFVGNFIGWAGHTVWNLLEIVFDVVSPGAWSYIKKTGAALKSILKNPLPFVHNLVSAAKLGFDNFTGNIGTHLKTGLLDWLTGSLQGVYIPKALTLGELGMLAMSVLGITWAQIRGKIVKALGANGESIMKGLETGFDVVVALVKGGVKAAWELIKEKLTDLKDTVISGITSFVIDSIVHKAIPKIIAMFIPGAGFISAIISIYDTVKVFIDKLAKIIAVVKSFVDSIVAIAAGQIGGAAKRVEGALAGGLSLAISFLAGFLGLGNIAEKILGVIEKIRASVDKALDAAVEWVVSKAKSLGKFVKDKAVAAVDSLRFAWGRVKKGFSGADGEAHTIYVDDAADTPRLMIASNPTPAREFFNRYFDGEGAGFKEADKAIKAAEKLVNDIAKKESLKSGYSQAERDADQQALLNCNTAVGLALSKLLAGDTDFKSAKEKYLLEGLTGTFGSMPKPVGDRFTADHQPQAAIFEAADEATWLKPWKKMKARAAGRASAGIAINLHHYRHTAGRTYGGKGGGTKNTFVKQILALKGKMTLEARQKTVVELLKQSRDDDVTAMEGVVKDKNNFKDITSELKLKPNEAKALIVEIAQRIDAGEKQIKAQNLDSLLE